MSFADRSMGLGLRALNRFAALEVVDRVGLRRPAERLVRSASKGGFKAATVAGRTFARASRPGGAARPKGQGSPGLFDLTPSDEQQMLSEAFGEFSAERLRPAALDADNARRAPAELLEQAAELGITMIGVPEELGGAVEGRSAVTTVLVAEALSHGDLSLAFAALAPGAVATAISLWGDAEQQGTYLPELVGESPPAAALAVLEPTALFDPFALATKARRRGDGFELSGVKSLVPRAGEAELFVVAAELDGTDPALFLVESKAEGLAITDEPAMGLRAAATARLELDEVELGPDALLGGADPAVYAELVQRSRIAWSALAVGTAQAALDYVIPYVNERHAFGEPISNRQAVAFNVSDIAIETNGMRLATYRAASRADMEMEFARDAALARRLAASHGTRIGSDAVQLLGGHGYVKEHPVERWYRDLRAAGMMEGGLLV